jgi:hypothetical protein
VGWGVGAERVRGGVRGGCGARLVLMGSLVVVTLRAEVARRRRAVAPGLCAVSHAHAQPLELLLEAVGLIVPDWGWVGVGAGVRIGMRVRVGFRVRVRVRVRV